MEFKTEGDTITPVMQPGTIEAYQKPIDLDPNGTIGVQAKQGLGQLQAMGVGITTKLGSAPARDRMMARFGSSSFISSCAALSSVTAVPPAWLV
jgi:hypothetical protein